MMAKTHLIFAFLLSILTLDAFNVPNPLIFIILTLLFSIVPDIDHPKSRLGHNPLSLLLFHLFGHRQLIHSIFIPIILFFIFVKIYLPLALAIMIGYSSHLVLDCLNKAGLRLFFPLKFKIKGPIKTKSLLEKLLFLIILLALLLYLFLLL